MHTQHKIAMMCIIFMNIAVLRRLVKCACTALLKMNKKKKKQKKPNTLAEVCWSWAYRGWGPAVFSLPAIPECARTAWQWRHARSDVTRDTVTAHCARTARTLSACCSFPTGQLQHSPFFFLLFFFFFLVLLLLLLSQ